MTRLLDALNERRGKPLLVVTGAGISLASGIPTFRGTDPGAIWANDVLEKGTIAYFHRNPLESWKWYLSRFEKVWQAQPNPAHRALAQLERLWGENFLLVTQNIDTLHEQAGSQRIVKVHGSSDKVRCSRRGCPDGEPHGTLPMASVRTKLDRLLAEGVLPRCDRCNKLLRPHVLWFDEYYSAHDQYEIERVKLFATDAAVVLFIGTSFSVGVTQTAMELAGCVEAEIFAIDPGAPKIPWYVRHVCERAEDLLPTLAAHLAERTDG